MCGMLFLVSVDPSNLDRAREIAAHPELVPVGILYRNDEVPRYEELRMPEKTHTPEMVGEALNSEFDRFTIEPVP